MQKLQSFFNQVTHALDQFSIREWEHNSAQLGIKNLHDLSKPIAFSLAATGVSALAPVQALEILGCYILFRASTYKGAEDNDLIKPGILLGNIPLWLHFLSKGDFPSLAQSSVGITNLTSMIGLGDTNNKTLKASIAIGAGIAATGIYMRFGELKSAFDALPFAAIGTSIFANYLPKHKSHYTQLSLAFATAMTSTYLISRGADTSPLALGLNLIACKNYSQAAWENIKPKL